MQVEKKNQVRLIHRSGYYFHALESGHLIIKVVTTYFGIHYSNLNDFAASTCSHSLCRTSGGEDIEERGDLLICN